MNLWIIFLLGSAVAVRYGRPRAGPCSVQRAIVMARYRLNPGLAGLEIPNCDANGNYAPVQYAGSTAHCVTLRGIVIEGFRVNRWETANMNCRCARDQYAYLLTGLVGRMFNCESNGNYAKIGCTGSVCYCQDSYGRQIGTTTVHITQQDSLNC